MSKKQTSQTIDPARLETIKQQLAYQIWEDEGRPEGRSEAHWLAACGMVDAMLANPQELPSWLKRLEQPASAAGSSEAGDAALGEERGAGLRETARRFARDT